MNHEQQSENMMGYLPIPVLLMKVSLPMILSMLVQALYNVVDSIFVSRINADAFAALNLMFPIQTLMIAAGAGTGVGINALLSKSLGEKKFKQANEAAKNGIFLAICSYLLFLLIGAFGSHLYFEGMHVNAETVSNGTIYMRIVTMGSFGLFIQMVMERLLQSTGLSIYSMITQMLGAFINLILDPVLIFGVFGLPGMGAAGAAIATITGQIIAAILAVYFNIHKNKELAIGMKGFRPNKQIIGKIYSVGIPAIFMQAIGSIMNFGMNQILLMVDATQVGVNVFGAYFKLNSLIFMPVFGLNNGMIPILAYNYGARKRKRIIDTVKYSLLIAFCFMVIGMGMFLGIPGKLLSFFDATEEMAAMGVPAFRIICISFLFAGFCIVLLSVFQAFGSGMLSLIVSVSRQLLVLLPVAYVFAVTMGIDAVWWSFPIAEIASISLSLIFYRHLYRTKIAPLEDEKHETASE
ncbi:MAG: MATE family efflux transporter [Clostridiales bacterium]|nr:MATE family efflux transporter [Clostridiales bacterium]